MHRRENLGRTLIIANPRAHAGAADVVAADLQRFLELHHQDIVSFELVRTERPGHAAELACDAQGYDTVLALGGDGVVHEIVNGLMKQPMHSRPNLGLVPVGSGNDYARTLGMDPGASEDFAKLFCCERVSMDVGRIRFWDDLSEQSGASGGKGFSSEPHCEEFFVETFSVGLDAAIALGCAMLHERTGLKGHALYTVSGLDVFIRRYRRYPLSVSYDREKPREISALMLAVQIGPTYGSGYRVCPDADPADGLFDICCAQGGIPRAQAISLFLRSKNGRHIASKRIDLRRARRVELVLDSRDYPIQADGERIVARHLILESLPHALRVLRPLRT